MSESTSVSTLTVDVLDAEGKKTGTAELPESIFDGGELKYRTGRPLWIARMMSTQIGPAMVAPYRVP